MLWIYERNNQTLRVETRFDAVNKEYLLIIRSLDGTEQVERFPDAASFQSRITSLTGSWRPSTGRPGARSRCTTAGRCRLASLTGGFRSPDNSWAAAVTIPLSPPRRIHRCPKCDGVAKPINLKSEPGAIVVFFRCPYCHHAWSVKQEHPNDAA